MFREACDSHESNPHRDKPKLVLIRCIKTHGLKAVRMLRLSSLYHLQHLEKN